VKTHHPVADLLLLMAVFPLPVVLFLRVAALLAH
jgi:hypothetical protein